MNLLANFILFYLDEKEEENFSKKKNIEEWEYSMNILYI